MVFDTKHAIGMALDGGVELLLHMGIDTVQLNGQYFDVKVKDGDRVKKGDLFAEFDMEAVKAAGYRTVTPGYCYEYRQFSHIRILKIRYGDNRRRGFSCGINITVYSFCVKVPSSCAALVNTMLNSMWKFLYKNDIMYAKQTLYRVFRAASKASLPVRESTHSQASSRSWPLAAMI